MPMLSRLACSARAAVSALAALAVTAAAAAAQAPAAEGPPPRPPAGPGPAAIVELLGGVEASPSYLGSDDYEVGPDAALRFNYVRLPFGLEFGSVDTPGFRRGFGVRTSFRYIGSRSPDDDPVLDGTDRVDSAIELGFGLGYEAEDWRAFGVVRYGVTGHSAWVGEAGADAIFNPSDELQVHFGPRAQWGSDRFMQTYFGIGPEDAANSPLAAFDASSGVYAVGVELGARYAFSPRWGVEGAATYDRLMEDAGDSPITQAGSRDQFGVRLGITRTIRLGF